MSFLFDPIRKKNVACTPEERVRQNAIQMLLHKIKVPKHLIEVEFSLSAFSKNSRERIDIIVHNYNALKTPWLLAECKAPGQYSFEDLEAQLNRYLFYVTPRYIFLALGPVNQFFELKNGTFSAIETLPIYSSETK